MSDRRSAPPRSYRVETVHWDGHELGADHLESELNRWAEEGWEVLSIIPTVAGTSIRSLVGAAAANTTEIAVVLRRSRPSGASRPPER